MTLRPGFVVAVAAGMLIAVRLLAQTTGPAGQSGTASIGGVVTAADSGAPVSRAVVTLAGATIPGFRTLTDESGRFAFDRLPAGTFTLTASRSAYLTMAYGQAEPGRGAGLPIELGAGEHRTDVRWSLPRGATIGGRVFDHTGAPFLGAVVTVLQRRGGDGEWRSCCGQTKADANGFYRLGNLMPGSYIVAVVPPGDYRVFPEVLNSYGGETREVSEAEIEWARRELAGSAAGRAPGAAASVPARGRTMSYGRLLFPGATDVTRATILTVKAGEARTGVDVAMVLQPTATIRVRVLGANGLPPGNATTSFGDGWSTSGMALADDGTFERRSLLPGRYTITVRSRSEATYASQTVDVNGEDVNLALTMGPAASLAGRVVFESGEPAIDLSAVRVTVSLVPFSGTTPAAVGADGTFRFPIVDPGRYRLSASIPAASRGAWTVKSVTVAGVDAADRPVTIDGGETVTDVVVTFTTRMASVAGTLLTADGTPAGGYYVVLFADEPAFWSPRTRRVPPAARATTDGQFSFRGLPAGVYRLAALTVVDESDLEDPEFLASLKTGAVSVTLADGESKTQNLQFARR